MGKIVAIVLAGGSGKRMNSAVKKQYLPLFGKPLMYYALKAFQDSPVDEIVCVVTPGEEAYVTTEIIEKEHLDKVRHVVAGGEERYDSVYQGLCCLTDCDIVLIHDGARPFPTREIIEANIIEAKKTGACVTAVPVKDTIKVISSDGIVVDTPDRRTLWQVQTPQSFDFGYIKAAYDRIQSECREGITDDSMVAEYAGLTVKIVRGDYDNIKITTPEDMTTAEGICRKRLACEQK